MQPSQPTQQFSNNYENFNISFKFSANVHQFEYIWGNELGQKNMKWCDFL